MYAFSVSKSSVLNCTSEPSEAAAAATVTLEWVLSTWGKCINMHKTLPWHEHTWTYMDIIYVNIYILNSPQARLLLRFGAPLAVHGSHSRCQGAKEPWPVASRLPTRGPVTPSGPGNGSECSGCNFSIFSMGQMDNELQLFIGGVYEGLKSTECF